MPSLVSKTLRRQIKLIKPIVSKMDIKTVRAYQDKLGDIAAKTVAGKVDFQLFEIGGMNACFAIPNAPHQEERVVLYLHGGAYVSGNIQYAKGFAGVLATEVNTRVFCIAYRLAPENPFPAAVDDALVAYTYLLDSGYSAKNISLVGESAGGGLIYSLCLRLKRLQKPLPAAMVGISPWTDLTFSGKSYSYNKKKDPSLSEDVLRIHAAMYASGEEGNPLVSPIFGDLRDFPPSLLLAGGNELLLDDAKMLAERLIQSGSQCELIVEDGLWHVFVLFRIPEARRAIGKIVQFLRQGP